MDMRKPGASGKDYHPYIYGTYPLNTSGYSGILFLRIPEPQGDLKVASR